MDYVNIRVLPEYGSVYEIKIELDENAKEIIADQGRQTYIDNWVSGNLLNVKEYEEVNLELDAVLSQIDVGKITNASRIVIYVAKVGVTFMCCLDIVYNKEDIVTLAMRDLHDDDLKSLISIAKDVCDVYPDLCFSFSNGIALADERDGD